MTYSILFDKLSATKLMPENPQTFRLRKRLAIVRTLHPASYSETVRKISFLQTFRRVSIIKTPFLGRNFAENAIFT